MSAPARIAYRARPQNPAQPNGPWRVEARRDDGSIVELTRPEGLDEAEAKAMAAGPALIRRVHDVFENEEFRNVEHVASVLEEALALGGHWSADSRADIRPMDWADFGPRREELRMEDALAARLEREAKWGIGS